MLKLRELSKKLIKQLINFLNIRLKIFKNEYGNLAAIEAEFKKIKFSYKKFATGKGNANKVLMYEAFIEETGDDLAKLFEFDPYTGQSPVSDIIDSYYIAKYSVTNS